MNYGQVFHSYEEQLEDLGEDKENLAYVFCELKDWTLLDFLLHQNREVPQTDQELISEIFNKLAEHQSPQYITGKAYFRDLTLKVDPRALIPRPETEELVDLILAENSRADLQILDIGTGSGAIAISLAKERPSWQVTASDISQDALDLAQENSRTCQTELNFVQSDVFSNLSGRYDIIVSNPPYISYDDMDEVGSNVLASEPHLALFAEEDGYAIYRRIIEGAKNHLAEQGKLYFEISYKQGQGLADLLAQHFPKKRVRIIKDMYEKDRMVVMDNG